MTQPRKQYMGLISSVSTIGYSRLHLFRKEWTVKQIKLRIYELMRPLIKNIPKMKQTPSMTKEDILQREYDSIFLDTRGNYDLDNPLYDIEIHNNLPVNQGNFYNSRPTCDFCGVDHKDNCIFAF